MAPAETRIGKADETAEDELDVEGIGQQNEHGLMEAEQAAHNDEGKDGEDGSFDDTCGAEEEVEGESVVEKHLEDERPADEDERRRHGKAQRGKQEVGVEEPRGS